MQHDDERVYGMGEAIEECIAEAWVLWCKEYAPATAREVAWANDVYLMKVELELLKEGRVRVQVKVQARQPWKSASYFTQFQQILEGALVYVASF